MDKYAINKNKALDAWFGAQTLSEQLKQASPILYKGLVGPFDEAAFIACHCRLKDIDRYVCLLKMEFDVMHDDLDELIKTIKAAREAL